MTNSRRGRPRSQKTRAAILKATLALITERGVPGVTIEAVAALAGVGKPTIYRYWSNAHELTMTALMETPPTRQTDTLPCAPPLASDPLQAVRELFHRIAGTFGAPTGRYVATMLAAADESSEVAKAFRTHFIQARRREAENALERAKKRGVIPQDADTAIVLDMLFGAVLYRLLMGGAPLDADFIDRLLAAGLAGVGHAPGGNAQDAS